MNTRHVFPMIFAGIAIALAACEQEPAQEPAPAETASDRSAAPASAEREAAAQSEMHTTTGSVTAVDPVARRLTIAHEPVPSLQWPAMTMQFQVADAGLLEGIAEGDEVRFSFVQDPSGSSIIRVLQSDDQ
jgi:Cu/Ag efflux protein CusF